MMNIEERIRFLIRAASRAEGEGDQRVALLFRRMAEEMKPLEQSLVPAGYPGRYGD
jgi:hypothetical protein